MNKEEYNVRFSTENPDKVKKILDSLECKSKEELDTIIRNIHETYLTEMNKDIRFWVSMFDYCNHIKYLDISKKEPKMFITSNIEFLEFIEDLKKKINYLDVISVKDTVKAIKELDKEGVKNER